MRPNRLVVGEVRAEECLDLLLALNAGENIGSRFVPPWVGPRPSAILSSHLTGPACLPGATAHHHAGGYEPLAFTWVNAR